MTGSPLIRSVVVVALSLLFLPVVNNSDSSSLLANRGKKGTSSKSSGKTERTKKSKGSSHRSDRSRGSTPSRRYTIRGNPDVTRSVAIGLIAEKLPDLAALVGIEAVHPAIDDMPATAATMEAPDGGGPQAVEPPARRTPELPVARVTTGSYVDEELSDEEDPDKITDADFRNLNELPDDINSFYKEFSRYMAGLNGESTVTDNGVDKVVVMESIISWVGTRYLFGGMGRGGIDCSAYTGTLYRSINFKLPRTAAAQWEVGVPIERDQLQFGDLIFFNTRSAVYVSHVGMYLGNGYFTHASSRNGVTVSSLGSDYYSTHMIGARRYDVNATVAANEPLSSTQ